MYDSVEKGGPIFGTSMFVVVVILNWLEHFSFFCPFFRITESQHFFRNCLYGTPGFTVHYLGLDKIKMEA